MLSMRFWQLCFSQTCIYSKKIPVLYQKIKNAEYFFFNFKVIFKSGYFVWMFGASKLDIASVLRKKISKGYLITSLIMIREVIKFKTHGLNVK